MTNETIVRMYPRPDPKNMERALDLARADERTKMAGDVFAEYFNTLQGGEVASAILTQLLRRGVTDDDLRGLRLQWIKEQQEENFYCADWNRCGTSCEEQCAACGKTDNLEQPEGVEVWVSWDSERIIPIWVTNSEPIEVESGRYDLRNSDTFSQISVHFATKFLKIKQGECAKFRIVRVEE